MDQESFDRLARLLGEASDRRAGLKAALAAVLGGPAAVAALEARTEARGKDRDRGKDGRAGRGEVSGPDAGRRKRRKTCKPACGTGFDCVKVGKKRECICETGVTCGEACCALGQGCVEGQCRAAACDPPCGSGFVCEGTACVCPSGVECGDACCASGQTCEGGVCAGQPEPDTCIVKGQPCKAVGRRCCGGLRCASGQGGDGDVACYVPKTGACTTNADCVYGTGCIDGRCAPPPPPGPSGLGQTCIGDAPQPCVTSGAACTAYTGTGGPAGDFCSLPLRASCTGDPDCTCYRCAYPAPARRSGRRDGRASTNAKACCQPVGGTCAVDQDCCLGGMCVSGRCGSIPDSEKVPSGGACDETTQVCRDPRASCVPYGPTVPDAAPGTFCLLPDGEVVNDRAHCVGRAVDGDSLCRTCTIYGATHAGASDPPAARLAALKAALESAAADAPNPVWVGTGLYKPASTVNGTTLITVNRGSAGAPLQVDACFDADDRPVIDGGATVTGATDMNAENLTWANGNRIMKVNAGTVVEIDGIDLQHGHVSTNSDNNGCAIDSRGTLALSRLKIWRSACTGFAGNGGAICAYGAPGLTLSGVEVIECKASGSYADGGALYLWGTPLTLTGTATRRTRLLRNFTTLFGGAFALYPDTGKPTLTMSYTDIEDNVAGKGGAGFLAHNVAGSAASTISNSKIAGNACKADSYGGGAMELSLIGGLTLTDVEVSGNSCQNRGGIEVRADMTLTLGKGTEIFGNTSTTSGPTGIDVASGAEVVCPTGTTARVCGNPTASPTGTTNCGGAGTYTGCTGGTTAVCKGTEATPGSAACS